uniref:Uncharacterized protein n=1 Tax=Oryza punctata TaxID=4537 RepID=A0A0E0KNU0_ORYPU
MMMAAARTESASCDQLNSSPPHQHQFLSTRGMLTVIYIFCIGNNAAIKVRNISKGQELMAFHFLTRYWSHWCTTKISLPLPSESSGSKANGGGGLPRVQGEGGSLQGPGPGPDGVFGLPSWRPIAAARASREQPAASRGGGGWQWRRHESPGRSRRQEAAASRPATRRKGMPAVAPLAPSHEGIVLGAVASSEIHTHHPASLLCYLKHVPSESFWPYLNITAQQEQLFKQDSLQSSLFVAFKMVWLTSKYETSVRIKS